MVLVLDRQRTDQRSTWPAVFIMAMLNDGNHSGLGWLGTHTGWVLKEGESWDSEVQEQSRRRATQDHGRPSVTPD